MTLTVKNVHRFQIMSPSGDDEFEWDADDPEDVRNAREKFEKLRKQGYMAYKKTATGRGEMLRAFDPLVERVIFRPPMAGG